MTRILETGLETVICEIPTGQALQVVKALKLEKSGKKIRIEMNASDKMDKVVISDLELSEEEAQKVALFAPHAKVAILEKGQQLREFVVSFPKFLEKILPCPNQNCITNAEPVATYFHVFQYRQQIKLCCRFCERTFCYE